MAAFINVFAFLFALTVSVRSACQEGFTRYDNSCYLAIQLRFHWADARYQGDFCSRPESFFISSRYSMHFGNHNVSVCLWSNFNGACLYLTFMKYIKTLCKSMGAHLLQIETAAEMSTIRGFFAQFNFGADTWWLGATNIQDDFEFRWEDSQKALTYKPWGHLQPDNADGKQHCLSLDKHFRFDDKDCDFDHVSFVCEASYHLSPVIVG